MVSPPPPPILLYSIFDLCDILMITKQSLRNSVLFAKTCIMLIKHYPRVPLVTVILKLK